MKRDVPRIAIVGGGIAGTMLAWRLLDRSPAAALRLFTGAPAGRADATGASGGLVRGFEIDPRLCLDAADSLAELYRDRTLQQWAGYRETGSHYVLPADAPSAHESAAAVAGRLAGPVTVTTAARLGANLPLRQVDPDSVVVHETRAGYLSPGRLRDAVLNELGARGVVVTPAAVTRIAADGEIRLDDEVRERFDAIVVAAGAWTPRLLTDAGFGTASLRTKAIQYLLCPAAPPGLTAFVDETSGLYGRPDAGGRLLVGLPDDRWAADPDEVPSDLALATRVRDVAATRLGVPADRAGVRCVAAADCYHDPPGLALRPTEPATAVHTFTGGSGGAAKTVFAASATAANRLGDAFGLTPPPPTDEEDRR